MREYKKIIILSSVLLILIVLITLVMIFDVDFMLFKNLSIAGIGKTKNNVETLVKLEQFEEQNLITAKDELAKAKTTFDEAKNTYNNIDESTIAIVQEATKNENYFIEYLWVVLGNYAKANNLEIDIVTPGSTIETTTTDKSNNETENANTTVTTPTGAIVSGGSMQDTNKENTETTTDKTLDASVQDNAIKIVVRGRYSNVADFVFDVENDKELRFKLDNITMTYLKDNSIEATFNVLSLNVKK